MVLSTGLFDLHLKMLVIIRVSLIGWLETLLEAVAVFSVLQVYPMVQVPYPGMDG